MATTNYLRFITAVRVSPPGTSPEHITAVKWLRTVEGTAHSGVRAKVVEHIEKDGYVFHVAGKSEPVKVVVVDPGGGKPKYIRTAPNDSAADNLLALPRY